MEKVFRKRVNSGENFWDILKNSSKTKNCMKTLLITIINIFI